MKKKAILKTVIGVTIIGACLTYFMWQAMQSSWAYYYSVDELIANKAVAGSSSLRVAGRVKAESVVRDLEKTLLTFALSGSANELPIQYKGSVPDNFTEGKEVVVEGRLDTAGVFHAETLMTKCESKYKARVD